MLASLHFFVLSLAATAAPTVTVGDDALAFSLPAVNEGTAISTVGKPLVTLADFVGLSPIHASKAVVLYFFDRAHGGEGIAALQLLQRRLGSKGVQVVAIAADSSDLGGLSKWIEGQRVNFPVLRDTHGVVVGRYGFDQLPVTLVVDAQAKVFAIGNPSVADLEAEVSAEVKPLISPRQGR